ncbi:MAG: phosphatidate cytidylyltransferase [Lachnospiraceae bacterium]|nr:phosphatidate cytidylyltransferase [Lachnospiraceae bacterium]
MFKTRLISGIVLVIVMGALLTVGGDFLWGALIVISLIGMFELYRVVKMEQTLLGVAGYLAAAWYALWLRLTCSEVTPVFAIGVLVAMLTIYVFTFPRFHANQVMTAYFGVFYVAVMLFYLYRIRLLDEGYLIWLVFLASWGCDTCAYCTGMLFGRHKLAPVLSPKKSVEGALGGIAGAALLGFVFGRACQDVLVGIFPDPAAACAGICAVSSVISQVGDLAASAIKRNHEVKDYGNLIPGHGGILDRFDSVIFVAPVIFYAISWWAL